MANQTTINPESLRADFSSIRLLIFDLDGTLIDSRLDLVYSVNATLEHLGRAPLAHEVIESYVGNGVAALVHRALGPGASKSKSNTHRDSFLPSNRRPCSITTSFTPALAKPLKPLVGAGWPV